MSRKEALSQFINQIHGRPVVVKLNSGVDYRGEYDANGQSDLFELNQNKLIIIELEVNLKINLKLIKHSIFRAFKANSDY